MKSDYLQGAPRLPRSRRVDREGYTPPDEERATRELYLIAAEIRRRRPPRWQYAAGSESSKPLSLEVREEIGELLRAGMSPLGVAEVLGVSFRAARREMWRREKNDHRACCLKCRAVIVGECVACAAQQGTAAGQPTRLA